MNKKVTKIIRSYSSRIFDNKIYFTTEIPKKKLTNALNSYAQGAQDEIPLVLIDNTIFGNAKNGALLTSTTLYAHNTMERPKHINLEYIQSVFVKTGILGSLHINGTKFLDVNQPAKDAMQNFTKMLSEIVSLFNPDIAIPQKSSQSLTVKPQKQDTQASSPQTKPDPALPNKNVEQPALELQTIVAEERSKQKEPSKTRQDISRVSNKSPSQNKKPVWPSVVGFLIGGIIVVPLGMAVAKIIGFSENWATGIGMISGVVAWSSIASSLGNKK